jgi:hypothetical protein
MEQSDEIGRRIFSLFIDLDNGASSIKFGGYDTGGVKQGEDFNLLMSNSDDVW